MEVTNPSHFGTIIFGEPETVEFPYPGDPQENVATTRSRGEWCPPDRLRQFLPDGFSVPLDCYTGPDGLRRIILRCNFEELIDVGAVGGLAVLHGLRGFDKEVDRSYRAMFLIHQHVRGRAYGGTRGMKEHLTRKFEYARDVHVRSLGRLTDDQRDVLAEDVGLNTHGEGHGVSVAQLTENGRQAAREAGCRNPISKQAIAFGLLEAAKMNPLKVGDEEVPHLVRMALFDIDSSEGAPYEELVEIVAERLLEAVDPHLDDSQEAFDQWFSGPSNSLVKQIAQQKKKRGGELSREDVRQALLCLGWRAYDYVGQCIDALMRTIKNAMPDPLNDDERRLFERMYERQPYYGNLPLALLAERLSFLRLAILAIWEAPQDQDNVRVLHRLLWYFADMVSRRREADRQSKQRSEGDPPTSLEEACTVDGATREDAALNTDDPDLKDGRRVSRNRGMSVRLIDNLHCRPSAEEGPFAEIADHIRELKRIKCDAGCERWEYHGEKEETELVTIAIECRCGRVAQKLDIPLSELTAHAKDLLKWRMPAPGDCSADSGDSSGQR